MPAIPFRRFVKEILGISSATRSRITTGKLRQALGELAALGIRSTSELTPALMARFIQSSRERGTRSDISTESLMRSLSSACTYAHAMGYLRVNPFRVHRGWGLDLEPEDVPRFLTLDQLRRLVAHLNDQADTWKGGRLRALAALVAYTGMRRGEALFLQWSDIDLERGFVMVPRRRLSHRAKTRASAAPVPIPPELSPILRDWRRRAGSRWCFPGVTLRGPWTGGSCKLRALGELQAAADAAGIGHVTFRLFRHSFATHAPRWGLDPIRLKQVLRHTNLRTQNRYIHPDEDGLRDAVKRVSFG